MPDPINIAKFDVSFRPDGTIGIECGEALVMRGPGPQSWVRLPSLADAETLRDALSSLITLEHSRRQRQSGTIDEDRRSAHFVPDEGCENHGADRSGAS